MRSINGVQNGSRTALFERDRDPGFERLTEALQLIQREVGIGVRVQKRANGEAVLVYDAAADERFDEADEDVEPGRAELREDITAGNNSAIRTAMILTTTSNSTRVNALLEEYLIVRPPL